ncbi:hypothetical protein PsorP6_007968 [Peronosclerospora sorghi]|uniref:Uncharacterized protein n=1 Tax=Peronosclerospora sorghi TaxID=230839 RepID=A0ACC0W7Z2_9STRA|nr:hypothetical protein PsorP6_007968 [Peronosclerospora sorghi]
MMHTTAGSLIRIGEIALLPLDVLKNRAQTNPAAIAGKSVLHIVKTKGLALYRGAAWTAARNAPGSFPFFGGSSLAKDYIFQLENYNHGTFFLNFVASISSASVVSSICLDGTTAGCDQYSIQSRPFDSPEIGMTIVRNLLKAEGPGALFKGLIPKLFAVCPKLVFSYFHPQI